MTKYDAIRKSTKTKDISKVTQRTYQSMTSINGYVINGPRTAPKSDNHSSSLCKLVLRLRLLRSISNNCTICVCVYESMHNIKTKLVYWICFDTVSKSTLHHNGQPDQFTYFEWLHVMYMLCSPDTRRIILILCRPSSTVQQKCHLSWTCAALHLRRHIFTVRYRYKSYDNFRHCPTTRTDDVFVLSHGHSVKSFFAWVSTWLVLVSGRRSRVSVLLRAQASPHYVSIIIYHRACVPQCLPAPLHSSAGRSEISDVFALKLPSNTVMTTIVQIVGYINNTFSRESRRSAFRLRRRRSIAIYTPRTPRGLSARNRITYRVLYLLTCACV